MDERANLVFRVLAQSDDPVATAAIGRAAGLDDAFVRGILEEMRSEGVVYSLRGDRWVLDPAARDKARERLGKAGGVGEPIDTRMVSRYLRRFIRGGKLVL